MKELAIPSDRWMNLPKFLSTLIMIVVMDGSLALCNFHAKLTHLTLPEDYRLLEADGNVLAFVLARGLASQIGCQVPIALKGASQLAREMLGSGKVVFR